MSYSGIRQGHSKMDSMQAGEQHRSVSRVHTCLRGSFQCVNRVELFDVRGQVAEQCRGNQSGALCIGVRPLKVVELYAFLCVYGIFLERSLPNYSLIVVDGRSANQSRFMTIRSRVGLFNKTKHCVCLSEAHNQKLHHSN